jgi:hypothetical protein
MTSTSAAPRDHSAAVDRDRRASSTSPAGVRSPRSVPVSRGPEPPDDEELLEADFDDDCNEVEGADWVEAAPFRAHVRRLITEHGVSWRTIAVLVEVPPTAVEHLLRGHRGRFAARMHPLIARRLYQLTDAMIRQAQTELAPAAGTRTVLRLLIDDGWSIAALSARTNVPAGELEAIVTGRQTRCTRLTAATVKAAGQVLHHLPAPDHPIPDRPDRRARRAA